MNFLNAFKNSIKRWKGPATRIGGTTVVLSALLLSSPALIAEKDDAIVYSATSYPIAHAPAAASMMMLVAPSDEDPSTIFIPTQAPISVSELPSTTPEQSTAAVNYVKGNVISNEPGGTRPVELTVKRETIGDEWMGDQLVIGPKEAALTTDMLHKDGGTVGVFDMPPAEPAEIADLQFTLTGRGAQMLSKSEFGLAVNALYAQFVVPATTMQVMDEDMNIQLRTDHTLERPKGAQCTPMQIIRTNEEGILYVTLPVENKKLSKAELQQLKVYANYKDGTTGYVNATLTSYDKKYPHGMKFRFEQSGDYTVVLPQK